MLVRREQPGDVEDIAAVHRSAFATADGEEPGEVAIVAALRASEAWLPRLSLVAVRDGATVGHVCITAATIGQQPVGALGPIGVRSDIQGRGIGSALMHGVLAAADALDLPLVGLLGHLEYYPRFGFVPGDTVGIAPSEPEWASHFQVRTLAAYDSAIAGEFRYAAPFYGL